MTKEDEVIAQIAQLGGEHDKLTEQINAVRADLRPLILTAHNLGIPQVRIADLTGYTRETIRTICLPPEQAAAEREARRKRRRKDSTDE